MEDVILLSQLNDFIFCPVSIYFHNLYGDMDKTLYQNTSQIAGTKVHESVDKKKYSHSKNILMSMDVFCEKYRISGKIDMFDIKTGCLTERKKKIKNIYDGYVFQLSTKPVKPLALAMGSVKNDIISLNFCAK